MPHDTTPHLARISDPHDIAPGLRQELIGCWIAVTNAGGAARFPFPPVGQDDVAPVMDGRLGWRETGRWPDALRFAPHDTRDEILMILAPL
ncbi:hypothetical protein [Streptomyces sp. UNOB3_S3]|uniref:hypothetical protein n=1 Tax=Streptomyces sp. UNOB3_S3 TaxID=2871682 RepID=UPI001E37BB5F|nr:hypothetical protein [Streptomyces sp. UNOB3_S3]MCC3777296.1 hypothetical protein [Streptomyces sp. UNOB3_S3]